jgi:hypothetical protein
MNSKLKIGLLLNGNKSRISALMKLRSLVLKSTDLRISVLKLLLCLRMQNSID